MNEEEIREELNKVYTGESWDVLLDYITKLQNNWNALKEIEKEHQKINGELREENKKLKEVIDEAREYVNEKIKFNDEQIKEYKTCITTNINGKFSEETKENMEQRITTLMSVNYKMRGILQILDKAKENK